MYYKPYLVKKITIFGISIEPAGTDISAAILVNLAVNAEIPPSALLTPKVSKRQNKYKKLLNIKGPRDCRRDTGQKQKTKVVFLALLTIFFKFSYSFQDSIVYSEHFGTLLFKIEQKLNFSQQLFHMIVCKQKIYILLFC